MKRILLLGVGLSTHTLVKYLVKHSETSNICLVFADLTLNNFIQPYLKHEKCHFVELDINDDVLRKKLISDADVVISMLPPKFHIVIAKDCILFKKDLITASYVSDEIRALDSAAKNAGILILNEVGLDPGIDHISAMDVIDDLHHQGAKINIFKSFCGGLISPEYDNNPWNYKFTWNPKNVVLAGKSGALYLKNGSFKKLNYNQVFQHIEHISIPNYGTFESYANRDSLHYQNKYNLVDAHTIVRGTLRKLGFSQAWDVFVQLGMTSEDMPLFINKTKFNSYLKKLNNIDVYEKMQFLDLFNPKYHKEPSVKAVDILLDILIDKLSLNQQDKDMIVMQHQFEYTLNNECKKLTLSMVVKGDDSIQTAMAKTVGLPVFFACKLLLKQKINLKGVRIPVYKEIYAPILQELKKEGIDFVKS